MDDLSNRKIKLGFFKFKIKGNPIKIGDTLNFIAKDSENNDWKLEDIKGKKVISTVPMLNTKVCDLQTIHMNKIAEKNSKINIISITMDKPKKIDEWCIKHNAQNHILISDNEYEEFANKTNLATKKPRKLARGLLLIDQDNKVIDISFKEKISELPDFDLLDSWIKNW